MATNKIHILVYSGITILLIVMLNFYIADNSMYQSKTKKIDNNYAILNETIATNSSDNLLLVIGNSYVNASFNPTINEDVIKFSVFGMTLIDAVNIIENLPENTPIKNILVGIGYNDATSIRSDSSSYDKHFASSWLAMAWSSLPMVRGRSLASTMVREDIHCLSSYVLKARCNKELFNEEEDVVTTRVINSEDHELEMAASTRQRLKEYIPFTSSLNSKFQLYIQRLKAASDLRGVVLYAYTAPIYKELMDQLDPEIINEFRSVVMTSGVNYVDMNLLYPNWGAIMFSDATHVSMTEASDTTTQLLLKRIFPSQMHVIQ